MLNFSGVLFDQMDPEDPLDPSNSGLSNVMNVPQSQDLGEKRPWICSLEDALGSLIWVALRDDTFYVGIFKTFDQYGNILISDSVKKIVAPSQGVFCDIYCGNVILRGESIAYFSQVDSAAYFQLFNYKGCLDSRHLKSLEEAAGAIPVAGNESQTRLNYVNLQVALEYVRDEGGSFTTLGNTFNEMLYLE
ncbi:bifunctional LSM domain [Babesia duncani]|uniref:U6 snRNA-associated Sm-like protein LSm1 n=1 Tax=Babesia duncani TaxID=323732 RepID=A0AAD9PLC9_9APIC|nr:bifunctional LSM domain [Babesia duncani]